MRRAEGWPQGLVAVARRQEGLVGADQLVAHGVTRSRVSRGVGAGRLTRVLRGVYDVVTTPYEHRVDDPDARRADLYLHRRRRGVWLALLAHGPETVAVGQSALVVHGVDGLPWTPKAEVTRLDRRERHARHGVELRRFGLPGGAGATVLVDGRRVVVPEIALGQAVPELPGKHAIAVLDSALRLGVVDAAGLDRARTYARGRRGAEARNGLWDLVDGRAESPVESVARKDCIDHDLPPDALQLEIVDDVGRLVARCDLAWRLSRNRWLLVEIDGLQPHSTMRALVHDRHRQNLLITAGHTLLRFTGADAWRGQVAPTIAPILARAGWRPGRVVQAPITLDGYAMLRKGDSLRNKA